MFILGENPNVFQDKQLELRKLNNDTEHKLNIKKEFCKCQHETIKKQFFENKSFKFYHLQWYPKLQKLMNKFNERCGRTHKNYQDK